MQIYKGLFFFLFFPPNKVKLNEEKQEHQGNTFKLNFLSGPSDLLYQENALHSHIPMVTENCSLHLASKLALLNLGKLQHLL